MRKSKGDLTIIQAVGEHIEEHIGKIDQVLHEKNSPYVHVDVNVVAPTPERNHYSLITSGMSEKPMPVPNGALDGRFAELVMCLPAHWPLTMEAFQDEQNWWPLRLLKCVARYPHENKTWLYGGHSIIWSDPPRPFAQNTRMTSVLLMKPRLISSEAQMIHVKKTNIFAYGVCTPSIKRNWNSRLEMAQTNSKVYSLGTESQNFWPQTGGALQNCSRLPAQIEEFHQWRLEK